MVEKTANFQNWGFSDIKINFNKGALLYSTLAISQIIFLRLEAKEDGGGGVGSYFYLCCLTCGEVMYVYTELNQ
jgi:hypothetical protein